MKPHSSILGCSAHDLTGFLIGDPTPVVAVDLLIGT